MSVPHDIAAEQACLGACLLSDTAFSTVAQVVGGPSAFYRSSHQAIFSAMAELSAGGVSVDLITVTSRLRAQGALEDAGGPAYLDSLQSMVQCSAHAEHYAEVVGRHAFERRLQRVGRRIEALAVEPGDAAGKMETAARLLEQAYTDRERGSAVHIRTALEALGDDLNTRTDHEGNPLPHRDNGIPFGFSRLDEVTGGMAPGTITIVAARPAMGKTAFALGCTLSAAERGPVYCWSGEMPRAQIARRVAAMLTRCSPRSVRPASAYQAAEVAPNLWVDDERGIDSARLSAKFAAWHLAHPDCSLLVIDYLSLLADNDQKEVSRASRAIMTLAGRHAVPVLELQQLSRKCEERTDKRPVLSDLRESGQLEQDASLVLMLYRDGYYNANSNTPDLAECWVRKSRDGESGKAVRLHWDATTTRFSSWVDAPSQLRRIPEPPYEHDGEDFGIPA